jgi:hypothetical protein
MVEDAEGKQGPQKGQKKLQPCDELREVHGCCAQDGVDLIAKRPFSRLRPGRCSLFMCPMIGSIAARRFINPSSAVWEQG